MSDIYADAQRLVARVLDSLHLTHAHVDTETGTRADGYFRAGCPQAARLLQGVCGYFLLPCYAGGAMLATRIPIDDAGSSHLRLTPLRILRALDSTANRRAWNGR